MNRLYETEFAPAWYDSHCRDAGGCPKSQSHRHCERSEAIQNTVNHWIASGYAIAVTGLDPCARHEFARPDIRPDPETEMNKRNRINKQ
jgi:hypothetical protein